MSDLEFVEESLTTLGEALGAFVEAPPEQGTGAWTMYRTLLERQVQLLHERAILAGEHQVEMDLSGSPVIGNSIDSKFLGGLLQRFQDAVTSVTQTLMAEARDRGSWGGDVLASSRMRVTTTAPGSFVVGLEGPQRSVQLSAIGTDGDEQDRASAEPEPVFDEALDLVLDVLHAASNDMDSRPLLESASVAGGRAVKHLQALAKEVASNTVVAKFVHRSPFRERPRSVQFGYAAARHMESVLSRTETSEETVEVFGRLIGASWLRERFEIQADEDGTEVIYKGTVNVDLRGQVQAAFDTDVWAVLEKTTVTSDLDDEPTISWHLVAIRSA